jgi:23S rRNA (cytidine1920-2'-O)/16S rRNA (cytidine1409-2'-O)-methyltransferase
VRDPDARRQALDGVVGWLEALGGWQVVGTCVSPILGGSGNEEFLLGARKDG